MQRLILYVCAAAAPVLGVCLLHFLLENSRLESQTQSLEAELELTEPASPPASPKTQVCTAEPGPSTTSAGVRTSPSSGPSVASLIAELEAELSIAGRARIIRRLGDTANAEAIGALEPLLDDDSQRIAQAAADAIGRIGGLQAAGVLEERLYTRDHAKVSLGVHGLSAMTDALATSVLIRSLDDPRTLRYRSHMVSALGRIGDQNSLGALTQVLYEGSPDLRSTAALALAQIPKGLEILLTATAGGVSLHVRRAALTALGERTEPQVDELIAQILGDPTSPLREQAISILGRRKSPKRIALLGELAMSGGLEDRQTAINALASIDDAGTVSILERAMKVAGRQDRPTIIYALGRMNTPEALTLARTLLRNPDATVSRTMAAAVSWSHPELLIELDPRAVTGEMRTYVFRALVQVRGQEAAPTLIAMSRAEDPTTAEAALRALSELGSPDAEAALVGAAMGEKPRLASAALTALGGLRALGPEHRAAFLARVAAGDINSQVLYSLGRTGPAGDVRDALVSALKNGDQNIHYAVANALSRTGAPGTGEILKKLAADPELSVSTRRVALNALAQAGTAEANTAIVELARGGTAEALQALRSIHTPEACAVLTTHARGDDEKLAGAAIQALSGSRDPKAVELLVELVEGDTDRSVQAIYSLNSARTPSARKAVLDAAWGGSERVRSAALSQLTYNYGDSEALPAFRRAISDEKQAVSSAALSALEYRQGAATSDLLGEVLEMDISETLRKRAAQILKRRGGSAARDYAETIEDLLQSQGASNGSGSEVPMIHFESLEIEG